MCMFQQIAKAATHGSHLGSAYRVSRGGGARRTILGAEDDEPRPILDTVNAQPRPIFNNDPGPILGTDNDHPSPIFWIDQAIAPGMADGL